MNRQVLASEALKLSRSILRQVPLHVRIASIAHGFLRHAFSQDDMVLAIGLQALVAMEKAGTPGDIGGQTIDELRPFIKRNALGKLKSPARQIGGKIFNMSLAKKVHLRVAEEAWSLTLNLLERHAISGEKNVGQVLTFISNGFTMRIKDVLKTQKRRREIEENPEFSDSTSDEEPRRTDVALWKEIERRFRSEPDLMGPKGEPWAWIYIEGKAAGMTESEIIDQWNEASRRSGGEGEVTRSAFLHWLRSDRRRQLMVELTKLYLDESTLQRLKLACRQGSLSRALLQPYERELLELLAA